MKNIKTFLCQQSTKESTKISSSILGDLSSETTAEGSVQLNSTSVFFQPTSTSISTQLTPILIYVPPALPFPIQPTSISAVVLTLSSTSP